MGIFLAGIILAKIDSLEKSLYGPRDHPLENLPSKY